MGISKHTPGPWIVCTPSDSTDYLCIEEDSQLVGEASTIAEVNLGGEGISEQIGSANARLIAAAPDLLAALQEIIKQADDPDNEADDELVSQIDWQGIRAAIAKAEGKVR